MKLFLSFILICLIFLPYRLYHLTYPIADSFNFRQTQTATFALNMYKNGINMFRTELDIFGPGNEKYLTLEFPVYEAIVSSLYSLFFFNDMWGRIVSIIAGYIGAWYVLKIVVLVTHKQVAGLLSAFFFLSAPLNMFYHRAFMIEPTIIVCLLIGVYYVLLWVVSHRVGAYIAGMLFFTLGFMQKGLYGPFWLLPIVIFYLMRASGEKRVLFLSSRALYFSALILVPLVMLFIWQHHINLQNTANGQLFFTTSDAGHREWNFGFLSDRLSWEMWRMRISQIFNGIVLKPGFPLFLIGVFSLRRFDRYRVLTAFLISSFLYVLVVFRIQVQNYYQLFLIPAIVPVLGLGIYAFFRFLKAVGGRAAASIVCALLGAVFLSRSWNSILPSYYIDWEWYGRLRSVDVMLPANARGIFITAGNEWNSSYTYFTRRKMKQIGVEKFNAEVLQQWKTEGYSFLYLHERERYAAYLAQESPGNDISLLYSLPVFYSDAGMELRTLTAP